MFSIAVKSIETAIKGSIIFAFGIINPDAAIPKDKLCAKVKTEH
jgi:hypothetical protein